MCYGFLYLLLLWFRGAMDWSSKTKLNSAAFFIQDNENVWIEDLLFITVWVESV